MSCHKKSKLEADLERHRMSNFQAMGRKFVKLEAGYEGELSFMDGSPSMFWLHIQSDGLFNFQEYLRISYGRKMRDGGGEGLDTGSPVLAKYSVDGLYYRARIQEVMFREVDTLESMYSVVFVDYGNSGVVFGKELVAWDSHLDILPEQV